MANVRVYVTDNLGHISITTTNSSGAYIVDAFNGTDLYIVAEQDGYSRNYSLINVLPGDQLWMDFGLLPLDAWLTGVVTDVINGTPVANAGISMHSSSYDNWVPTNATGEYNFTLLSGNYSVDVNAPNYQSFSGIVEVFPGANIYNISLMPFSPKDITKLYGWINDSVSNTGISNAQVEVGLASPYQGNKNSTLTDGTGQYEIWIPPVPVQYVVKASGHTHAEGIVNATGQTSVRLDALLTPDPWGPNVTFSQSTTANISWNNPSWINMTVQENDPQQFIVSLFMFRNASAGTSDYALVSMLYYSFDPLNPGSNNLPFTKTGSDTYDISYEWTGDVTGGWLKNLSDQQYFGSFQVYYGPTLYNALRADYYNSTLGTSMPGTAWFDNVTGDFAFFSFDNGMMGSALPSDPTGTIAPEVSLLRVNDATLSSNWIGGTPVGNWSVVGLRFEYNTTVPSGKYLTDSFVSDFGGNGWGNITLTTVDNDLPVANAGPDLFALDGDTVAFDGTASTDDVGIANYTWTFVYDGSPITLYGPSPSFQFLVAGYYNVTLTVRDGAGHASTDVVQVTVTSAIPEFPTVVVPISGMILLFAVVQFRRKRPCE
jgi:hypothetical protein